MATNLSQVEILNTFLKIFVKTDGL